MFIIIGSGLAANNLWTIKASSLEAGSGQVTRLQAITGSADTAALSLVIIVSVAAFALFTYRHWRRIQSYISRGERLIYQNAWVDVTATFIFTVGFVLTRSVIIR